jgi:hypothetical protein
MATASKTIFYVYEHWRPDKDVCFWVGKGNGDRAYRFHRNFHYDNVVKKLSRIGMCVEVRLVKSGLDEDSAFALERERIAFWRSVECHLTNYTNGGEGPIGLKHTEETRRIIREKRKRQKISHSAATRAKIGRANSVALKGKKNPAHSVRMTGRKHSPEHCAAIGAGNKGKVVSEETRAKIRASNLGKRRSAETKRRLSESHRGNVPTEATRTKMKASHKKRWENNPELHSTVGAKLRACWANAEYRAKMIASRSAQAADPIYRAKRSAAAKADWARRKERQLASS